MDSRNLTKSDEERLYSLEAVKVMVMPKNVEGDFALLAGQAPVSNDKPATMFVITLG
ncbi:hypothetical protein GJ744_003706 [Endocarpon pusillum]|uniref:Uncharacterized protein n=1 Tax=Endocarpon pusillum TaxID=364733 RepID=A0A8H7A9A1_9EURO|nr:hypothetical protein GJ744_003706 [Endocarpon pusillum]